MDMIFLALIAVLGLGSYGLAYGCERLRHHRSSS